MRTEPVTLSQRYRYGTRKIQLRYRGFVHQYSYGIGNTLQRYIYGIGGPLQRYSYGTPSIYTKAWRLARLFLSLFSPSLQAKTPNGANSHKNAALVMPRFGLTVEKRPGAAIEGGSTRIRLLADSELTQVNKTAPAAEVLGVGSLGRHRLLTRAITQLNSGWLNPC